MSVPSIVCIGAPAQDVFLMGETFTPECEAGICYEHLKLGDKLEVEEIVFASGGNAMNASVTFARQNMNTSFVGVIGTDPPAQAILAELDAESVHTEHLVSDVKYRTSYSVILLAPNGERTILNRHGEPLSSVPNLISKDVLQGDWLYISSVGSMDILLNSCKLAQENGMKVAFNPATFELNNIEACAEVFRHINLLALNAEEAALFVDGETIEELAQALSESVDIVLVSDGPKGAVATDGTVMYKAGLYEDVPVIDRTGAGDSFTSGFVAYMALGKSIDEALVFASANSTSVVGKIGAKAGILKAGAKLHEMPIEKVGLESK